MAPKKTTSEPTEIMVVNDVPGEECRIAILEDSYLEELYSERNATATKVGNIYKGRVVNVEAAIQAAFIDYGEGVNGFLHISDLHPRYFPGGDRVERVGRKIPRRERPPIQEALKRGDHVLVQVLKEGIGTKGPTLTSYLSIPGRLLVVMPEMDRVGVSRRVEDEEGRREMRKVLDTLDLPEGFGFILRTAGVGRTKTELKRDVAYLMRLWKVMEKRIEKVGAPCELYTESDLLIRTVRDVLRPTIKAIVVDSESAYDRIAMFLQVIAPRSAPKVIRYRRPSPIFHAFDVERQIDLIHSREVPLKSGGRLVIDQTEALVAIDVNSGKSRSARDSETNAYQTNCEAVDEICRQLRLRDLGGLIIHDLIDMRQHKNRRAIEARFQENLRRDRARSTILRISDFGLVEMTRQRMRPSMRKSHFMPCPHCDGNGEIKSPESVASEATRHVGYLLDHERIRRVEIACSSRVASVLLSRKRRALVRLEETSGKTIDVRVSDHIGGPGIEYYAYDARNADIDLAFLPGTKMPKLEELEAEDAAGQAREDAPADVASVPGRKRRRRRRGGPADASAIALAAAAETFIDDDEEDEEETVETPRTRTEENGPPRKKRRRRGGRSRRRKGGADSRDGVVELREGVVEPRDGVADSRDGVEEPVGTADVPELVGTTEADATPPEERKPVRVHELAKELGVKSREVLDRCAAEGTIECANHMTSVAPADADTIRGWFGATVTPATAAPDTVGAGGAGGAGGDAGADAAPVDGFDTDIEAAAEGETESAPRRRRRKRGGRRRGGRDGRDADTAAVGKPAAADRPAPTSPAPEEISGNGAEADPADEALPRKKKSRRSRRGGRGRRGSDGNRDAEPAESRGEAAPDGGKAAPASGSADDDAPGPITRMKKIRPAPEPAKTPPSPVEPDPVVTTAAGEGEPVKPVRKRRTLYGSSRRTISPVTVEREATDR